MKFRNSTNPLLKIQGTVIYRSTAEHSTFTYGLHSDGRKRPRESPQGLMRPAAAHRDEHIPMVRGGERVSAAPDTFWGRIDLARIVGLSLGMTNAIRGRLAGKGWITIGKVNNRNIRYAVTPAGIEQITPRPASMGKQAAKIPVEFPPPPLGKPTNGAIPFSG